MIGKPATLPASTPTHQGIEALERADASATSPKASRKRSDASTKKRSGASHKRAGTSDSAVSFSMSFFKSRRTFSSESAPARLQDSGVDSLDKDAGPFLQRLKRSVSSASAAPAALARNFSFRSDRYQPPTEEPHPSEPWIGVRYVTNLEPSNVEVIKTPLEAFSGSARAWEAGKNTGSVSGKILVTPKAKAPPPFPTDDSDSSWSSRSSKSSSFPATPNSPTPNAALGSPSSSSPVRQPKFGYVANSPTSQYAPNAPKFAYSLSSPTNSATHGMSPALVTFDQSRARFAAASSAVLDTVRPSNRTLSPPFDLWVTPPASPTRQTVLTVPERELTPLLPSPLVRPTQRQRAKTDVLPRPSIALSSKPRLKSALKRSYSAPDTKVLGHRRARTVLTGERLSRHVFFETDERSPSPFKPAASEARKLEHFLRAGNLQPYAGETHDAVFETRPYELLNTLYLYAYSRGWETPMDVANGLNAHLRRQPASLGFNNPGTFQSTVMSALEAGLRWADVSTTGPEQHFAAIRYTFEEVGRDMTEEPSVSGDEDSLDRWFI